MLTRESETRLALIAEILQAKKGMVAADAMAEAEQWFMRGYSSAEVSAWLDAGVTVDEACGHRAIGYGPHDFPRKVKP